MSVLLLTSAGMDVQDELKKILPKIGRPLRVAQVITASKPYDDRSYIEKDRHGLESLGLIVEDVDIENKKVHELRQIFSDKDIIFVQGGNTFYLMRAVRESGFDTVVREFLQQGKIYVGVSAGTIIAGTDIVIAEGGDTNDGGLTDMTGMKLVDLIISPHYSQEREENSICGFEERTGEKVVRLRDDQALLVKEGTVTLVGGSISE